MTRTQLNSKETELIRDLQAASQRDDVSTPSLEFKRDWAYGNAGLEDKRITREMVNKAVKD